MYIRQPISRIQLLQGDITDIPVDAIVNTANSSLPGGGGVDAAIHRAGGSEILEEYKEIVNREGACATGDAVMTTAGKLPAKYVIHAEGPVWEGGHSKESKDLENSYESSLTLATENDCKTIAFPCISTGVYRFPKKQAAEIAVKTVRNFLDENEDLDTVFFVCRDEENYDAMEKELRKVTELV